MYSYNKTIFHLIYQEHNFFYLLSDNSVMKMKKGIELSSMIMISTPIYNINVVITTFPNYFDIYLLNMSKSDIFICFDIVVPVMKPCYLYMCYGPRENIDMSHVHTLKSSE